MLKRLRWPTKFTIIERRLSILLACIVSLTAWQNPIDDLLDTGTLHLKMVAFCDWLGLQFSSSTASDVAKYLAAFANALWAIGWGKLAMKFYSALRLFGDGPGGLFGRMRLVGLILLAFTLALLVGYSFSQNLRALGLV